MTTWASIKSGAQGYYQTCWKPETTLSEAANDLTTAPLHSAGDSTTRLDIAIYAFLLLFAGALPLAKSVAQSAYSIALVLWLAKLIFRRERPLQQPLIPALLAFISLSAISSVLSPTPVVTWHVMKQVALLLIAVLVAQNLRTLRQIKTVVLVLIASTLVSIGYTGWQYAHGIGAEVVNVAPGTELAGAGLLTHDIILKVDRHRVHTPTELASAIRRMDPKRPVKLQFGRGDWLKKFDTQVSAGALQRAQFVLARPPRAQGSLGYTVTYAHVLLQVALLAWGLLLAATVARKRFKWVLLIVFVLICVTLGATVTRAALLSLCVAGVVTFWVVVPRGVARGFSIAAVVLVVLAASLWVHRERGIGMVATGDAGTQYRLLMWEDGLRLIRQHPVFGVGMDSIKLLWRQYHLRAYERFQFHSHFHSEPIQIAAERGLPVLAAWIWLMVLYVRLLLRMLRHTSGSGWVLRGIALGMFGAAVGFLVSTLVHSPLTDSATQMTLWLLMGTTIAFDRSLGAETALVVVAPERHDETARAA
ncbi:MAG: O-antigen ligase family protein [Terriglobales bacterium]